MTNSLWPLVVALVGWIVFNAVGNPVLRFFDLRTEVRRTMILYANVRAIWNERDSEESPQSLSTQEKERLSEAENQYRDLASQMRAFADTQSPTCFFLKWFGFDPRKASTGLIGMSNTVSTYGTNRAFQTKTVNDALKFPDG